MRALFSLVAVTAAAALTAPYHAASRHAVHHRHAPPIAVAPANGASSPLASGGPLELLELGAPADLTVGSESLDIDLDLDLDAADPTAAIERALRSEGRGGESALGGAEEDTEDEEEEYDPERPPIASFDVGAATVAVLAAKGITHFTPIQAKSFSLLKGGADMLGRSRTGTGKTLAFALPLITALAELQEPGERLPRGRTPRMVVLAPTRELARQVSEVRAASDRPALPRPASAPPLPPPLAPPRAPPLLPHPDGGSPLRRSARCSPRRTGFAPSSSTVGLGGREPRRGEMRGDTPLLRTGAPPPLGAFSEPCRSLLGTFA